MPKVSQGRSARNEGEQRGKQLITWPQGDGDNAGDGIKREGSKDKKSSVTEGKAREERKNGSPLLFHWGKFQPGSFFKMAPLTPDTQRKKCRKSASSIE